MGFLAPAASRAVARCGHFRMNKALLAIFVAALALLPAAVAEDKKEEQPKEVVATERAVSIMLLGSIGFQMLLFYLVNWPDIDIKKYSWQVISQTISIFCAVLLFQGFNGLIEAYVMEGGGPLWEVTVDMLQLVFWLTAMQTVLAITSGAVNELFNQGDPVMETVELNVKSWSVLFSHTSGFAAINAWGSLQQHIFYETPAMTLLAIPIGWCGLIIMYHGYDQVREYIAVADDGVKDEFEHLWDEETEEAEHDVAGLSLSFLTVQSIRFYISGVLPNQEGAEDWPVMLGHSKKDCYRLLGCGFVFFIMSLLPLIVESRFHKQIHALGHHSQEQVKRVIEILNNFFTFGNAWCFFFGVKWAVASTGYLSEDALLSVVLALLLSFLSFMFIFVLDKILDNNLFGDDVEIVHTAVEKLITALGILIGFSWEQSFDTAVDVVADTFEDKLPPSVTKLFLSIVLVTMVFPAWRLYILKTEQELSGGTDDHFKLRMFAGQHQELFMNKDVEEHALDMAHLKMKQHRRAAHGHAHPADTAGLRHLQVTASGIREVDKVEPSPKAKAGARRSTGIESLTESLLS